MVYARNITRSNQGFKKSKKPRSAPKVQSINTGFDERLITFIKKARTFDQAKEVIERVEKTRANGNLTPAVEAVFLQCTEHLAKLVAPPQETGPVVRLPVARTDGPEPDRSEKLGPRRKEGKFKKERQTRPRKRANPKEGKRKREREADADITAQASPPQIEVHATSHPNGEPQYSPFAALVVLKTQQAHA